MTSRTAVAAPPVDRRIIRTKRYIRDALTELIEEKGFERITVSDITTRADINRGTFYAHYRDKNDLMRASEDEVIDGIMEIQDQLACVSLAELFDCYQNDKPLPYVVALYDYLRGNASFMRAVMGPKGDPAFTPRLKSIVSDGLIREVLNAKYRENISQLTHYYLSYYTAAQLGLIWHWLESGMQESSEEMSRVTLSIMFMHPGDAIVIHGAGEEGTADGRQGR